MNEAQAVQVLQVAAGSLENTISTTSFPAGGTDGEMAALFAGEVLRLFDGGLLRAILKVLSVDRIMDILEPILRKLITNDAIYEVVVMIIRAILEQLKQGL